MGAERVVAALALGVAVPRRSGASTCRPALGQALGDRRPGGRAVGDPVHEQHGRAPCRRPRGRRSCGRGWRSPASTDQTTPGYGSARGHPQSGIRQGGVVVRDGARRPRPGWTGAWPTPAAAHRRRRAPARPAVGDRDAGAHRRGPVWMKAAARPRLRGRPVRAAAPGRARPRAAPIATDTDRAWMVLRGRRADPDRQMEGDELVQAMAAALRRYAELQRLVAAARRELVPLGAADMRPAVLPRRVRGDPGAWGTDRDERGAAGGAAPRRRRAGATSWPRRREREHRPQRPAPGQRVRRPAAARLRLGRQRGGAPLRLDARDAGLRSTR